MKFLCNEAALFNDVLYCENWLKTFCVMNANMNSIKNEHICMCSAIQTEEACKKDNAIILFCHHCSTFTIQFTLLHTQKSHHHLKNVYSYN